MSTIDELRAKQKELEDTEKELKNTKDELNKKTNELESARLENEDKKTELIKELMDEVEALRKNAENYEQQIASISTELATLRENFSNNPSTTGQTTTEAVSGQTTSEAISGQTTSEAISEQTTTEAISGQTTQKATESETTSEINLDNYEGFDKALSQLIFEIEGCAKTANYSRGLNESGKETLKTAKAKLDQYKKIIKGKQKNLKHEFKEKSKLNRKNPDKTPLTLSISAAEINELKNRRTNRRQKIEFDIKEGQNGKSSNITPRPNQSIEQIKKGNRVDSHHIEYDAKLNEALNDAAFLRIIDNNQDLARQFLQAIANNSLSNGQITFCKTHMAQLSPYFEKYGLTNQVNRCIQTRGGSFERSPRTSRATSDYRNLDRGEAFQQGGLAGIVDKALSNCNNLTPGQRNTWKSIAVLGGYAAGIYGLFKFFTNKNMGFWSKAGITAAAIFGSQALTGESPIALFNKLLTGGFSKEELEAKFGNAFGDAIDGVHNSSIEGAENISGAMYSLMVFNKNTKVGEVRALSTRFKNNPQEWTLFRGQAIENLGTKKFERFSTTFSENFDETKWNNWLNSIGIHDGIDDNKLVYELATVKTMNAIVINKFLSDNGVKVTDNKTKKEEYEQYIKSMNNGNQAIDIAVLEGHKNDRFEQDNEATFTDREKDKDNRKALEDQVEALSIDVQKKAELKTAIKRFYDERTIDSKPELSDFSLTMDGNFVALTSHGGYKSKIDINKNEIVGFGNGIGFSNLAELLNTADIANKILESQKGKLPKDLPVFQYKQERKGICFNDATSIWQDIINRNNSGMDTRVLSTGWGGATSKIENVSKRPNEYADYLSKRWLKENEINVDSTLYPTVKKLSESGIIFTNEQEVKNLEDRLKGIKENLKFAVSTPDGNPFSITFTNKLEFKAVNGDAKDFPENISEKFPTLLRTGNKEKFLKMMNDPNNKMRGLQ